MKIGMLTSGGDCQGLNSALRGVAKTLYNEFGKDVTLYGIRDGYRGLIEGDYHPMNPEEFSDILTLGGTILGTSRQPFKMMQKADENEETKLQKMLETCKKARFGHSGRQRHAQDGKSTVGKRGQRRHPAQDHRQRPLGHRPDLRF